MIRLMIVAPLLALTVGCGAQAATAPIPPVAPPVTSSVAGREVTVTRVVDGDTFEATSAGGGVVKVRVLGIDTPETKDPRKPVQCWGPEASTWATERLRGQRVVLVTDPTQDSRDRYGRVLAYVQRPDGWDYSTETARAGMARSYVFNHYPGTLAGQIAAAEREAQSARRGLWGPPCQGRR